MKSFLAIFPEWFSNFLVSVPSGFDGLQQTSGRMHLTRITFADPKIAVRIMTINLRLS
jgi:hypothetical protein